MIQWLLIFILTSLCWGEAPTEALENNLQIQEENSLVLVDLEGALFYPKAKGAKVTSIQNSQVAEVIKNYHNQQSVKILYLAEQPSEIMFWQNSTKASHLPVEESFSLSNEIFGGFEGSIPSCRSGIVLCQGHPLGEVLGLVINQLWIRTQFLPQKIIFFTTSKERGEIVSNIGSRMGASTEIKLVRGITAPSALTSKELLPKTEHTASLSSSENKKTIEQKVSLAQPPVSPEQKPTRSKKIKVQVATVSPIKKASPVEKPFTEPASPEPELEKTLPPIKIDESKLEYT